MRTLLAAALLLATTAPAQTHHHHPQKDQLRFTLILARHGIRPPLIAASDINRYSAQPWPGWEVPLGHLTPHGIDALHQLGAYMRLDFARNGLFPATGCPAPSDIYFYADVDERNISSTRATYSTLAPGCNVSPVHTISPPVAKSDPLFTPVPHTFPPPPLGEALNAMAEALAAKGGPEVILSGAKNPAIKLMANVLAPDPLHPAALPILDQPVGTKANASGDPIVTNTGPLYAASTLVEDFLLEYINNKPLSEVGWGRVDQATLRKLIPIHVEAFGYSHRTPFFARAESSNLLAHILDTLDQAATTHPTQLDDSVLATTISVPGAIGPPGTKLVYISGHDTNLFGVGGLLGLHWNADGRMDDTPVDSQIVFELWQRPGAKRYNIRIRYRAQTLDQLRNASPLTLAKPPAEDLLTPTGCTTARACPFDAFRAAALTRLDPAYVKPSLMPIEIAP